MFVVVMIVDGVEAVIVMSVRMRMIMMMVDGIAEKVCQKEKSIRPFPNE